MPDKKPLDPADKSADDFAAAMKAVDAARDVDQDEADIAADDAGATALGQKIDSARNRDRQR